MKLFNGLGDQVFSLFAWHRQREERDVGNAALQPLPAGSQTHQRDPSLDQDGERQVDRTHQNLSFTQSQLEKFDGKYFSGTLFTESTECQI